MIITTETFLEQARAAQGNPKQMADAGMNEIFRHEDHFCLDHREQVGLARDIGIIAGQTSSLTNPLIFIQRFANEILNADE